MAYLDACYINQSDLKIINLRNERKYLRDKEMYVEVAVFNELNNPIIIRSNKD